MSVFAVVMLADGESGISEKTYCPGVGLVVDGDLELVEIIDDNDGDN